MEEFPTPTLVIDANVVRQNIRRLADYAGEHGIGVRPHTKTHKSRRIAELQLDAGAVGLTIAKASEGEVITQPGDDMLLAYPPIGEVRAERLAKLAKDRIAHAAIDSELAIESTAAAARRAEAMVGLLVEIDIGMNRCGVATPQQALALAQKIDQTEGVRLDGIMCYPGHIWDARDQQGPALAAVSAKLAETIELWKKSGLEAKIVSSGSTPTAYQSHLVPELTEIRPGTYVYNDMNTVRGGYCELDDCAARIVCTVISNAVAGHVVVDAGSKTLTSDLSHPAKDSGHGHLVEYPGAKIVSLSEEHGRIDMSGCDRIPKVGDRVTIIPNHICPCVNLHDNAWWVEPNEPLQQLHTDARGLLV